ncbi:MAG: hypothetical protein M1426_05490 [Patescibacteria group bacterium]|nr:hypothetical protein [Patescibacteria group bacterium]
MHTSKNISETVFALSLLSVIFMGIVPTWSSSQIKTILPPPGIQRATDGPQNHFIGNYQTCPWSKSERYLLCLETAFHDRQPQTGDVAELRLVDLDTKHLIALGQTSAWNFQQGAMQQWLPTSPDSLVIYNDRVSRHFISTILNIYSGKKSDIRFPVSAVSHDGKKALSINFPRLYAMESEYGYPGGVGGYIASAHPKDDGIFLIDIQLGTSKLILSMNQLFNLFPFPKKDTQGKPMWFNHTLFNPSDTRILFVANNQKKQKDQRYTAAFTVNLDGSELRNSIPFQWGAFHFCWRSPIEFFTTTFYQGGEQIAFVGCNEEKKDYRLFCKDVLTKDGGIQISPDGEWMVSDTPPDERLMRSLLLANLKTEEVFKLGEFYSPPELSGPVHCDLHPVWNRQGTKICFNSAHEGTRQVYIMDLSGIVKK